MVYQCDQDKLTSSSPHSSLNGGPNVTKSDECPIKCKPTKPNLKSHKLIFLKAKSEDHSPTCSSQRVFNSKSPEQQQQQQKQQQQSHISNNTPYPSCTSASILEASDNIKNEFWARIISNIPIDDSFVSTSTVHKSNNAVDDATDDADKLVVIPPTVSVAAAVAALEGNFSGRKIPVWKMGNNCSYKLKHHSQPLQEEKMTESDQFPNSSMSLNGQLGMMNGVQAASTGNVHNKAAAFQRLNSTTTSSTTQSTQSQSVNQTVRTYSSSSSAHHQTNETALKSSLKSMQASLSQMKALSSSSTSTSSSTTTNTSSLLSKGQRMSTGATGLSSLSPLHLIETSLDPNGTDAPLDTGSVIVEEIPFPPVASDAGGEMALVPQLESPNLVLNNHAGSGGNVFVSHIDDDLDGSASAQSLRYEHKTHSSSHSTKFISGNVSTEESHANAAEMKRVMTGDVSYEENNSAIASRQKVEVDGVSAEKTAALKQEQRSLTQGGVTEEETRRAAAASIKLSTDTFTAEKSARMAEQSKKTRFSQGNVINEKHVASATQSKLTFKNQLCLQSKETGLNFDDLYSLGWESSTQDVDKVIDKYSSELTEIVETLQDVDNVDYLNYASRVMKAAWKVPGANQVGENLCETFRKMGGVDLLLRNFSSQKKDLRVASARLLEQSLTTETCDYVVEKGFDNLDKVVKVASELCEVEESRVGTGLLRHLFRHSEETCSDVLRLQGLERVMMECRRIDVETLRNCAGALVNLSLYGGADNQEMMIKRKVHLWLFPLAFHNDDSIKYYALLAIAVLVANKEIEAQILKSNTLQLVEPFLLNHSPEEFAATNSSFHSQGQSVQWLEKLVSVLSSQREEACSLAAFHFCIEAGIKKRQGHTGIFKEIHAIEPLKRVASSPNALASKFAAQALRLIGETVPHKLSQQVPLWSIEDVREWVIQKGFVKYADSFMASRVDGDLLLQLTEEMLQDDIKMANGLLRKRFMRDIHHLKKMADYSSCDAGNLNDFLTSIHPEFSAYTYTLLNCHVDKDTLRKCASEEVLSECGVQSSIHRRKIIDALKEESQLSTASDDNDKPLDVFISYRRSNGSQLASLLKVHLQLRGFTVFIDVERLEAGKFDNNLLQSIKQARNFILVLTPNALDRCISDTECKDWVHREIVAALESQCSIVPIMDNFNWPEAETLPDDMQSVIKFNGVKWIHDYQDACVDKLERFLRGEIPREPTGNSLSGPASTSSTVPKPNQAYHRTLSVGSDSRTADS